MMFDGFFVSNVGCNNGWVYGRKECSWNVWWIHFLFDYVLIWFVISCYFWPYLHFCWIFGRAEILGSSSLSKSWVLLGCVHENLWPHRLSFIGSFLCLVLYPHFTSFYLSDLVTSTSGGALYLYNSENGWQRRNMPASHDEVEIKVWKKWADSIGASFGFKTLCSLVICVCECCNNVIPLMLSEDDYLHRCFAGLWKCD